MPDIYETIWNNAASHVSVSRRGTDGAWIGPEADVLLDEGARAEDVTSAGALERPLFARVNEALFDQPSFATFIALAASPHNPTEPAQKPGASKRREGREEKGVAHGLGPARRGSCHRGREGRRGCARGTDYSVCAAPPANCPEYRAHVNTCQWFAKE